jgi:hypothetical protein
MLIYWESTTDVVFILSGATPKSFMLMGIFYYQPTNHSFLNILMEIVYYQPSILGYPHIYHLWTPPDVKPPGFRVEDVNPAQFPMSTACGTFRRV